MTTGKMSDWIVVDKNTGEEIDPGIFVENYIQEMAKHNRNGWEQVYPEKLIKYMKTVGCSSHSLVLLHLLEQKNYDNTIITTQRKIAQHLEISISTVVSVMTSLQDAGHLIKISNGVYQLDPLIMIRGGSARFAGTEKWRKEVKV